jgi:DNA repair exonuclease SbcCD ATPase subunit
MDDKPRRVPEEDDDSEGSTEPHVKLVAPAASSEKEVARLEHERIADLERQLSETLAAQTERDRRIAQLTDQLAQKSALLERAEVNVVEAKKRAGLELRELQVKLDESLLSRDHALEQAQSALQKATSRAADADERSQPAGELETELAEVRAELEGKKSELEALRLRLTDAEHGWAKSKAGADTLRAGTQAAAGLVNMDEDRVVHRLLEQMQAMDAEIASLRLNEKSFERMECRNEG